MEDDHRFYHVAIMCLESDFGSCFVFQHLVYFQRDHGKMLVQVLSQIFGKRSHIWEIDILVVEYLLVDLFDPEGLEFALLGECLKLSGVENGSFDHDTIEE